MTRMSFLATLAMSSAVGAVTAHAGGCAWSRVDHEVGFSATGIWRPNAYRSMMNVLTVAEIGGALWEGADSRIGRTMWQGIDAQLIGAAGAAVGKRVFRRDRPSVENDPCRWFQGSRNASFPSGEASVAAALVTPYILEYGHDHPAAYGLAAIPLYVGMARLKNHAHWQTDVLAGWAVGAASGWYAHGREMPIVVSLLPKGIAVGLRKSF